MINTPSIFSRLTIIGLGLLGGSVARAVRQHWPDTEIIGYDLDPTSTQWALNQGIINRVGQSPEESVLSADWVILAAPVGVITQLFQDIAPHLSNHTVITDVGSTKVSIQTLSSYLGKHQERFVPGHPIAGTEFSGIKHSKANLFQRKKVILTPNQMTHHDALQQVKQFWEACGADVHQMTAEEHDSIFALVSHLPHVLSYLLVHQINQQVNGEKLLHYAGSGFRDFTRIASSPAELWVDICFDNSKLILHHLEAFKESINQVQIALQNNQPDVLAEIFKPAQYLRSSWQE